MEFVNTALGIIASVLAILSALLSYKNGREIKRMRDRYEGNVQVALGEGSRQIMGSGNRVSGDDR